jgi:hypothetical protein
MPFFSYFEQTLHYFGRPHESVATAPVESAAAWSAADLAADPGWRRVLDAREQDELIAAIAYARATGKPLGDLRAADFPLPTLAAAVAVWRHEVDRGRGLQVVSGVPVDRLSEADAGMLFWCLGLHMGRPGAQNVRGDLLGHVTDTGARSRDVHVRLYETADRIAYHCDAADVVGLLCLHPAKRGGASRVVSSVRVYDELLRRRPDLVPRLYEPFYLDVRNEDPDNQTQHVQVPACRHAGGRLRTFYHSDYFRSAQRHADVPRFTPVEVELLDLYEDIANDPALCFDMELARGDIQWLSNHFVLHARTAYEDFPEPQRRRHLLRLWLSLDCGTDA